MKPMSRFRKIVEWLLCLIALCALASIFAQLWDFQARSPSREIGLMMYASGLAYLLVLIRMWKVIKTSILPKEKKHEENHREN